MSMIKEFAVNFGQAESIVMEDLVVEGMILYTSIWDLDRCN